MKYGALKSYLAGKRQSRIRMTFAEVAKAAKTPLPASAYRYPAWWANDPAHHAQARAWTDAGFKAANVNLEAQSVEFVRTETPVRGVREMPEAFESKPERVKRHPLVGWMKGTFTIEPGYDLTRPALDPEDLAEWEANLDRKADMIAEGYRNKK